PATVEGNIPVIAFLAHVDTSNAISGANVKPVVHRNYDGGEIRFPDDPSLVLSPTEFPYLGEKVGDDIVTASGGTLLGADDKAGVAIVMAAARHLLANPSIPHGTIRIGFTPDEEIGRGVHPEFPKDLGADFGYTLDGGPLGEIVYETFSADAAVVKIDGVSIHPGQAKDQMVNALHLAAKIVDTLPQVTRTPETTDGRQGFLHIHTLNGSSAHAELQFIVRSFEMDELEELGSLLQQVCATIQATEPRAKITCEITPTYRNMRYWLETDMRPVDIARHAADDLGITHFSTPTRGGTDGSRLTELGVPTPNLFTGMGAIHGPLEFNSVQDMSRATELVLRIAELWSKEGDA
ncbi:MAG: peptidase T, partial [Thermomicrobiales bacterium]